MNTEILKRLKETFRELYGKTVSDVYFAPGRVNLIGEHTDYNGGHVFPCALSMGIYGMIAPRDDDLLRMYSLDVPRAGIVEAPLQALRPGRTRRWTRYPEGVFQVLRQQGISLTHGADLMFAGDLPSGSGLSSSAAMEVLTALMLRDVYALSAQIPGGKELALIGQQAENEYCGMHCGIMDQFASAMGKKDHALYLDTETLEYIQTPLSLGIYTLVITNSGVKHSLVSSAYNDRRKECAGALAQLRRVPELADVKSLCSLTAEQFAHYGQQITDPVFRKRAKHAILENARTMQAVRVLQAGDLAAFGTLLKESHVSLRDDFEVSCAEMDFLAEEAWKLPGVAGSRMTGGGFGGCMVSIVRQDCVEGFCRELGRLYREAFGKEAVFYPATPADGARRL